MIQETTASPEAAKTDLDKAPKSKNTKAEPDALKADLDMLTPKIDQAKALANNGDYLEAKACITDRGQRAADGYRGRTPAWGREDSRKRQDQGVVRGAS